MRVKAECELNPESINLMISKLDLLADDIKIAPKLIVKQLLSKGESYAKNAYSAYPYRNSKEECMIKSDTDDDGTSGFVSLVGKSAFYEEFGTGELGASNSHPTKSDFTIPLKDYNSGPFVSTHTRTKSGKHYWFYKPMAGEKGYLKSGLTYGIPSGKMMYNTGKYLHKESKELVKEHGKEMLDKFK